MGIPILLVILVFFLTKGQPKVYDSKTRIYTGFASGSTIELENTRLEINKTNIAYDNLLNLIRSRATLEEVSLRLFTQHMLLDGPDDRIIGKEKYAELMKIVPKEVKDLVVKGDYDTTYANFLEYKNKDPYNFIYELINLNHPDYSYEKIMGRISVKRVLSSDFVDISFQSDDPGVCQNTLLILTHTFIKLNQTMKVNQSDEVVNYFKKELKSSTERLKESEAELLNFNKNNKLMNYYEQTKQIAARKELFEMEVRRVTQLYYGSQAVLDELEQKLNTYGKRHVNSKKVLELRDKMSKLNFDIVMLTSSVLDSLQREENKDEVLKLKSELSDVKLQLTKSLDTVFNIDHTTEGVGSTPILEEWLDNTIQYESSKAELKVLDEKRLEFDQIYAQFAPLGATMKRLERKINIAEQEYLSLLHSLGLAKLKQQNAELQTNIKISEIPNFPIEANPSKRLILVAVAGIMGFVLVASTILILALLDNNINTAERAEEKIGLKVSSIFPVINTKSKKIDFEYLKNKAVIAISRNIILNQFKHESGKPVVNMLFSTQNGEGKTFICKHLISKLCELDYKILHITDDTKDLGVEYTKKYKKLTYTIGDHLYKIASIDEFDRDGTLKSFDDFDFIILELPSIIKHPFPVKLATVVDYTFLVVRANRSWSDADMNALKLFNDATTGPEPTIILNGVKPIEMEAVLGDLPKDRSRFRRGVKRLIQMRFFTKSSIL
ncbi:hypothetical protein NBRC110019_03680 [Neptunitalea chrysea]|uniref:Tyrosine kinase G-rich domain-containing protein n=1 Tax=Neptunitalea chrysea TaxID=1647581 RepID=A0A9W6B4W2_9FLAO|nr:hypothetical protein [Neptunitalea chrysea]GLB51329.1 hypothetical protein NBRC110019_03680 [Neptunitalea chrysea]